MSQYDQNSNTQLGQKCRHSKSEFSGGNRPTSSSSGLSYSQTCCNGSVRVSTLTQNPSRSLEPLLTPGRLLLQPQQVYSIIKGFNANLEEAEANVHTAEEAAFKNWMNHHGVARSTIYPRMELRHWADCTVVEDAKTLWKSSHQRTT